MNKRKIFLTGSTGLLGSKFLKEISNHSEFEIVLGKRGLESSNDKFKSIMFDLSDTNSILNLSGIDIVVHLASDTKNLSSNSDLIGINKILEAVKKHEIKHLIFISIVGVDKVPLKYFRTKYQAENLIKEKCYNYSILRSTQFLEFFEGEIKKSTKKKFNVIPNLKYQPIDLNSVVKNLIRKCHSGYSNSIEEIGGREIIEYKDGIRSYQKYLNKKTINLYIPNFLLGKLGSSLTTDNKVVGSITWKEYLKNKTKHNQVASSLT